MRKIFVIIGSSIAGLLVVLIIAGGIIVNGYLNKIHYDKDTDIQPATLPPEWSTDPEIKPAPSASASAEPLQEEPEQDALCAGVIHVLLIGTDNRTEDADGRSDAMMLISINSKTSRIIATSFLRDIYLPIPGLSEGDRLNAAYFYGGPSLLLRTIEDNFEITVDKYVSVDFFSFIKIIDQVGGVTINVSDAERRVANSYIKEINYLLGLPADEGTLTASGEQLLNGKQALAYSRIRYVGNADFERTSRQRLIMRLVFEKVKDMNLLELNRLLNAVLGEITTNLSKEEIASLLIRLPAYSKYALDSWCVPVDGSYSGSSIRGMSVLEIDFETNIAEIKRKIYGD